MGYRITFLSYLLLVALTFVGCNNKTLNTADAVNAIAVYMEEQPIYESATFQVGQFNLRINKDEAKIKEYKALEQEGYIFFAEENTKKKWLAKDSTWTATIKLTDKSHPYVLEQKNNKIKVKTIEYRVNKDAGIQLEHKNNKTANAAIMLEKQLTPFAFLKRDNNPHTKFITRKFKLKYTEGVGWKVTK